MYAALDDVETSVIKESAQAWQRQPSVITRIVVILLKKGHFDMKEPAWFGYSANFRNEKAVVLHMLEHARGDDDVDGVIRVGRLPADEIADMRRVRGRYEINRFYPRR